MPPSRPAPDRRRRPGVGSLVAAGVLVLGAGVVAFPEAVGLSGQRPWVWSVPFRVPVGLGLAVAAAVGLVAARRWRPVLPAALCLSLVAGVHVVTTLVRGLGEGTLPAAAAGDVTVAGANVYVARADTGALADLVVADGVDVLSLPESSQALADEVAAGVSARGGTPMAVFFTADGDGATDGVGGIGTALLVSERLGTYRSTAEVTGGLKAVVTARPVEGSGPVLVAAHTAAPVPDLMVQWRAETRAVVDFCDATPGVLLAGDLNATVDHPALVGMQHCVEASTSTGTGAHGTWPASRSPLLGAPIDHNLADARRWEAVGSTVAAIPGSDHRAVVARWRPVPVS